MRHRISPRPAQLWTVLLLACGAHLALGAAQAPSAYAGTYQVAMCTPSLDVGPAHFSKFGNEGRFRIDQGCRESGSMRVQPVSGTQASRDGTAGWSVSSESAAPGWLTPRSIAFSAHGRADGGLRPIVEGRRRGGGRWERLVGADAMNANNFRSYHRNGAYVALRVVLRCIRERCSADSGAHVRMRGVRWTVEEGASPQEPQFRGSIVEHPVQRGFRTLGAATGDGESGVHSVAVEVNGTLLTTLQGGCEDVGRGSAGRISKGAWRPCGNEVAGATTATSGDTLPFLEGLNRMRACAVDFAGNGRCGSWRTVRVDNRCPISPSADTAATPAAVAAGKANRRTRFPARVRMRPRLLDSNGSPLATQSASICLTTKVAGEDRPGTRLVTPSVPSGAAAGLPAGPSRAIFVNYWIDDERVVTTRVMLRVRPRVKIRRRPTGTLRNGQTMRLRVTLPGPFNANRKVRLRVRSGGRWQHFRTTRTNRRGVARAKHTFRSINRRHNVQFRARVPRAKRPYLRGVSRKANVPLAP